MFVSFLTPSPVGDSLENFVVSRPKCETRVISGSSDLLLDFFFDVDKEGFSWWVNAVTEHEVIKDHDTFSGGQLQELFRLILSSTPESDHVEMWINGILKEFFMWVRWLVVCIGESWVEHVHGNIVCAFGINWISVDNYSERIICCVKFDASDTVWDFAEVDYFVWWVDDFDHKVINVRSADSIGPP